MKLMNKMQYMHASRYYSVLKRKEILSQATTCLNLEDIMLGERNQSQKTNMALFHLYEVSEIVKFLEKGSRMVVTRG